MVRREADVLRRDGCDDVRASYFDPEIDIWAITFCRDGQKKAILLWSVELDV